MRGLFLFCLAVILFAGCVRVAPHYRVHHQSALYFWTSNIRLLDFSPSTPRTSDSDLAQFWAHEWGVKLLFHVSPPGRGQQHDVDVFFNRYARRLSGAGVRMSLMAAVGGAGNRTLMSAIR